MQLLAKFEKILYMEFRTTLNVRKFKVGGQRVLPWQQYRRCHFVSFVMYMYGAKFEDHCSNISGDILNSVFYHFRGTIYDVISSLICIIQKREHL